MNRIRLIGAVFIAICILSNSAVAAFFTPLGYPYEDSWATAVSADGSVVVGYSRMMDPYYGGFRWTSEDGRTGIIAEGDNTFPNDVSDDGSVVVGEGVIGRGYGSEAFRWTSDSGAVSLGFLPGGEYPTTSEFPISTAFGVSGNGSVVVGRSTSASGIGAFRWTSSGGMVGLGDLPGGDFGGTAYDVSTDGSVIVGSSTSASGIEAFRWTSEDGMIGLGDLPGGDFYSLATGVSSDGMVVVGYSKSDSGWEAFLWTGEGGMIGLGDLPGGGFESRARGVSADGSVIVGSSDSDSGFEAFRWTREGGMQTIASILSTAGVDLTGWKGLVGNPKRITLAYNSVCCCSIVIAPGNISWRP